MDAVDRLAGAVRDANRVVALTGAGVSTASGIPDFRGESGVWERHDPGDFHVRRFRRDPAGFWRDRLALHDTMYGDREIRPNAAHDALAALAADGRLHALVTQNTDGLHAGIDAELIELHGSASRVACVACGARESAAPARERARAGALPPQCGACGGILKPDVVLFGERLDPADLARARKLAREAEVYLAVGSSLTVEPAASLPVTAARTGAALGVINLDDTPVSDRATYDVRADVTEALPRLRAAVADE